MRVNKITSIHTQIPYSFYSLPSCLPHVLHSSPENLGEVRPPLVALVMCVPSALCGLQVLHGDVIQNAAYELRLGVSRLRVLCKVERQPSPPTHPPTQLSTHPPPILTNCPSTPTPHTNTWVGEDGLFRQSVK